MSAFRLVHTAGRRAYGIQVPRSGPGVHERRGAGIVGQFGARSQEEQHHAETHILCTRPRRGAEFRVLQTQVR